MNHVIKEDMEKQEPPNIQSTTDGGFDHLKTQKSVNL